MDNSNTFNDENKQQGFKRQQVESPYSAATPKSRLGKEPKRLFGFSKANLADGNLEDTCIQSDSRPNSAALTDASFNSTVTSNVSYFENEGDPNLERTELYASGTSANATNLSMVQEGDETDADVTLATDFDQNVFVQQHDSNTTPTSNNTNAQRLPMSPIPMGDDSTPTAPTALASKLDRGLETVDTHSIESLYSPVGPVKSHIDYSLHEFEILEQKVEHEEDLKELQEKIEMMRTQHRQELEQIKEARIYEEKMLIQQMEAAAKKAKTERVAAKEREQALENLLGELETKMKVSDDVRQQLEQQLTTLNARIEELIEKAVKVDSIKQGASVHEDRIRELETANLEISTQLTNANKELNDLQQKSIEAEARYSEEERLRCDDVSSAALDEMKKEHENKCATLVEEIRRLETQVSFLQEQNASEDISSYLKTISELEEQAKLNTVELEQIKTETDEKVKQFLEEIGNLKQQTDEEKSSLQQEIEDGAQKAKAEQVSAIEREQALENLVGELKAKMEMLDDEKRQLEQDYSSINARLEELSENASKIDVLQQAASAYESRILELETANVEVYDKLSQTKQELVELQQKTIETEAKSLEEVEQIRRETVAIDSMEELKKEHEENRAMLVEEIRRLESEYSVLQSQQSEDIEVHLKKILELEEQVKCYKAELEQNKTEADQKAENFEEQIEKLRQQADEEKSCLQQQIGDAAEKAEWQAVSTKQREQELLDLAEELKAKFEVSEDAKKQLEQQLSALNSRVEELSEKTLQTDETRIRELEAANVEITDQLSKTKQDLDDLEQKLVVMEAKKSEEVECILRSAEKDKIELGQMLEKSRQELDLLRQQAVEEKAALQQEMTEQMESAAQKAAADLFAAKEKEGKLENLVEELEAKVEASDNAKQQLEQQLLALNVRVEELTQNALNVDSMQQGAAAYEGRIRDLEVSNLEAADQLTKANQELDELRQKCVEEIERISKSSEQEKVDRDQKLQHLQEQIEEFTKHAEEEKSSFKQQIEATEQRAETEYLEVKEREQLLETLVSELNTKVEVAANANKQQEHQIVELNSQVENLVDAASKEKLALQQEIEQSRDKLDAAEQALSQKENIIVTLESRIETISGQFEERLQEAGMWKSQAMHIGTMAETLPKLQQQIKELSEKLEASKQRVIEVEEHAQHDITIMQDERNEQSAALEDAKAQIGKLEEKLKKAEKEIERLENECDQFDSEERDYKDKISELQAEIKLLKGVKSPPKTIGLIQQARLGVKPLSRESSHVEPPVAEDGFEDAQDSFQAHTQATHQKSFNQTARFPASPSAAAETTMLHPDDQNVERSAIESPSSKKNRSTCQQQ